MCLIWFESSVVVKYILSFLFLPASVGWSGNRAVEPSGSREVRASRLPTAVFEPDP